MGWKEDEPSCQPTYLVHTSDVNWRSFTAFHASRYQMKADSVEVVECRKRLTTKIFASIGVLLFAVPLVGVIAVQLLRPGLIPVNATIAILCAFFLVVLLWVVTFESTPT